MRGFHHACQIRRMRAAPLVLVLLLTPGASALAAERPAGKAPAAAKAPPARPGPAPSPLDPRRLLPLVEVAGKEPGAGLVEPLAGALVVRYVELRPGGEADVTAAALAAAGVDRADLRPLAVKNLKGLLPGVGLEGRDGLYMLSAGGEYEASLLLVEDLWRGEEIAPKVKGEVVVAVPARDLLLVTGSLDEAGLGKLRTLVQRVLAEGTSTLSGDLLVWRGGRFVPFQAP